MNLRLEADAVRVRVDLDEARTLLRERRLAARLAFPGQSLELELRCGERPLSLDLETEARIVLQVPLCDLAALVSAADAGTAGRKDLRRDGHVSVDGRDASLDFEIDAFSVKKGGRAS